MKVIGVVSVREDTCSFLKQQLDRLFNGEVTVNRYALCTMTGVTELKEEQMLIFPGNDALYDGREKLSFSCPALLANRSLNYQRLDEVFGLPEGSEVYVLNDFKSSAYDAVRLFETWASTSFAISRFTPVRRMKVLRARLSRLANTTINVTICRGALKRRISTMKVEMIYLSQEDVIRCGGMSMDKAVDDLEEVFRLYDKGDYILPGKIVMKRPEPNAEETTGRINAMPGYIGGRFNMPGIKWDRQRSAESVQVRPAARLGRDRAERSRDQGTHCHHGRHTHQCDPHRRSNGRLRQVYGALALEDRRPFRRGPAVQDAADGAQGVAAAAGKGVCL